LVPPGHAREIERGAAAAGVGFRAAPSMSALLGLLRDGPLLATLISLRESDIDEPLARRLAREVGRRRLNAPFRTSDDLVNALAGAVGRAPTMREKARVFQALRIAVNGELEALEAALEGLREVLVEGGVIAVIAYHSLEDRIVKHAFREWSRSCVCPPALPICRCRGRALGETLTRSPVEASAAEVDANPRARSARLRAWRKAA
ncbi:MAG: 16S rRNA (cytosine(1402)-N(4))-methyltransferase, partial [Gemmatimonadetes bacterium]|nr:16S rRNA (cytosine(1402)-N(4))-methyltransferase [Gemmatimonadota bacterium]